MFVLEDTITIMVDKMIYLFCLSFTSHLSAQMRRPLEFLSALVAMVLNNSFYLYGIYLLAILSTGSNADSMKEYLVSTGMVLIAWGLLNVFAGGLYQLSSIIETGELETHLAKPLSPLLLVAISKVNLISLGEIFQGIATVIFIGFLYDYEIALKTLTSSLILIFGFASIMIFIGSLSFFSSRGSSLSYVILQVVLSLSLFPIGNALKGREKWILYFTPLIMTTFLPHLTALQEGLSLFIPFFLVTLGMFFISMAFFNLGLRQYKTKNYLFLNE